MSLSSCSTDDRAADGEQFPVAGELRPSTRCDVWRNESGNVGVGSAAEEITDLHDVEVRRPRVVSDAERAESVAEMLDVATNVTDHGDSTSLLTHGRLRSLTPRNDRAGSPLPLERG